MVALNFSPQFADDVEAGRKTQTIRQTARVKPGQRVHLYTGQRTKACRKLGEGTCTDVTAITLTVRRAIFGTYHLILPDSRLHDFAVLDGFPDYEHMWNWFDNQYKKAAFEGWLIRWAKEESKT